jgi:hypothetical protein
MIMYALAVGSIVCAMICTRPDIFYGLSATRMVSVGC